uniref:B30.2/SPRY domain-containing protein n=1 Tax=Anopheles epiroticus TaxID=199890 RepID=A0A182PV50_9DIPT
MAYTTQKQFLSIAFPNEDPKLPSRKRSDAVLKSYSSCYDNRAWSLDVLKQAQFIGDVANRALTQAALTPIHSFSGAELTKEILVRLSVDNLADYILSLRDEVKKKTSSIESLEQAKADLHERTETLEGKLKAQDEENRLLRGEIERIGACQEQQRQTNQFDEAELAEISQMIIDLRDYNENLEDEMEVLRNQMQSMHAAAESSVGDNHANVEAENNFLKFKAKDYDRLESELALFKAEYDSLTHQKRELAEEVQRAQQYRLRAVELKQSLKEELYHRERCEEQLEMMVNMYEQQSVELAQLKQQVHVYGRSSQDRLFDESTEDPDDTQTTATPNFVRDDADEMVETISFEPTVCSNCPEHLQHIEELKREVASLQTQSVTEDNALQQQQLTDLSRELTECKRQLQDTTDKYTSLRETSSLASVETKSAPQDQVVDLRQELAECQRQLKEALEAAPSSAENQQQIAALRVELADNQRQLKEVTDLYNTLQETSKADIYELQGLRVQLDQLTTSSDAPVGQLELFAANEKAAALQKENEKLRNQVSENKALIAELEASVKSTSSAPAPVGGECCEEKANKISELEQTISGLKAGPDTGGEENANLLQRITSLEKELQERDQKLKTLQEALDKSDGAQMSSLLSQLAEKDEMIKRLRGELDAEVKVEAGDDARACQEELAELRVRLEACEEEAVGRELVTYALPEPRKSVRISDEVEEFEPLSIKEELGSEQDEKETEEIKAEPSEDEDLESDDNAEDDGSETCVGNKKRLNSSLAKLEQLQENLSKRCTMAGLMGLRADGACDCIQAIAFKIAQGGLEMLLVAELYVLLQEICSAITRKNAVLGRNVTVLANSMTKCWQVITDARVMMNMELTNRTNHHHQSMSIHAPCSAVQEVEEEVEERQMVVDNRSGRAASHTAGHLLSSRPSVWSGMVETRPSIPVHQSMSVGSDDNRHSGALDVQRLFECSSAFRRDVCVAWFTFDSVLSGGPCSGLNFSNENQTVSVDGWEHRVALGSVGFSRGVHYWEFTIDKYTADTDPAFGVARLDVARDKMLGKDDKGFAMYIDRQRSWFQHNSVHERRVEGGISTGSTVGVLLDLERHTLHFIVNEMPQGSVAFRDLYGVFYPAVSVNRGVTLTLHTGLDAPRMDYH